jgi:SAM-dependent MidA family methyltransferase
MIKVSQFMEKALFESDRGYYRIADPIGKNSDFITAPEISQVFGELIAAYVLQLASSKKCTIALVEMGAGNGTMFCDILGSIKKLAAKNNPLALDFVSRATFHIVEISEALQKKQRQKLAEFDVLWHENFDDFCKNAAVRDSEIFFVSNELFDCFPIDQFVKTDIGWCERMVDVVDDKKVFEMAEFSLKEHQIVEQELSIAVSEAAPFGAVYERSDAAQKFMLRLSSRLTQHGGMAIIVDYGYHKTEFANTLQAIKNHQKVNVLENASSVDITALVDFGILEKIAIESGLNTSFVTQQQFLIGLGIEERKKVLMQEKREIEQQQLSGAIDRLIASDQMGELFKVLMVWK